MTPVGRATSGPPAEVAIDEPLVRALLRAQHPDLASLPLVEVEAGWDNAVFRLGGSLAVRLPRRALAAPLAVHEARWLPVLAPRLPLPTPCPVRRGAPAHGYPWAWNVVPWLPGAPLATDPTGTDVGERAARRLGRFLPALHRPAPAAAPRSPWRGIPLAARRPQTVAQGATPAELAAFDALAAAPPHHGPAVWAHGDLHPGNVLVDAHGEVTAVLDFGDLTAGDPAVDLAIGWMCVDAACRAVLFAEAGADAACVARSRAWAIALAVAYRHGAADGSWLHAVAARSLAAALGG